MKAKEHIYNLRTNLEASPTMIDTQDEHLMYMLDEARAVVASRKMDMNAAIPLMVQHIDVAPVEPEEGELGTVLDMPVIKLNLPKPIAYKNGGGIFTVGSLDGASSYTRITYSQIRTAFSRTITPLAPKWLYFNEAIYVINLPLDATKKVRIRGLFDEPWRVILAQGLFNPLNPYDFEYPLSMKDATTVYSIAMSGDLGWGDAAASAINTAKKKSQEGNQILSALQNLTQNAQNK